MSKRKFIIITIVVLFTIALVSLSFLDNKKVNGASDQVVMNVNEHHDESVVVCQEFIQINKDIIVDEEDSNPEYYTFLTSASVENLKYNYI